MPAGSVQAANNIDVAPADAPDGTVAVAYIELELAHTFLDIAASAAADGWHAHRNIKNAIHALGTADSVLRRLQPGSDNIERLLERRAVLAQCLRESLGIAAADGCSHQIFDFERS